MMHQRPDEDGRYPLSMKEYTALRTLFGAVNALDSDTLKERCKLFPGGWRDLPCAKGSWKNCSVPFRQKSCFPCGGN